MSDIAITVENLSKSYLVGHNAAHSERYTALRDVLARNARNLARKTRDMFSGRAIVQGDEVEEFWALKEVSFEIKQGDRLGIIGGNGAGKSTLLKILSRITEPTTGRIKIAGRVASLLEVGTGFHPELTGRENIFLNGAILGMTRREIQRKFDEIVAFAEVENFLDTPVKRYSSGMYVRLAFAVAAHLEPDILIVDEVLAVGDVEFQNKCLGKMDSVAKNGRTVIFVSHNEAAIKRLCEKVILLKNGQVIDSGLPQEVFATYRPKSISLKFDDGNRIHDSKYLRTIDAIIKVHNAVVDTVTESDAPELFITVIALNKITASLEVLIRDENLNPILFAPTGLSQGSKLCFRSGENNIYLKLLLPALAEGRYCIDIILAESGVGFIDYIENAISFNFIGKSNEITGWTFSQSRSQGCMLLNTSQPKLL